MNEGNTIILMLSTAPSWRYFAFLGELLHKETKYEPMYWGSEEQVRQVRALGASAGYFIDFSSCAARPMSATSAQLGIHGAGSTDGPRRHLRRWLRAYVTKSDRGLAAKVLVHVLNILRFRRKGLALIRKLQPRAVMVWGDNGGLTFGDFLRLCNGAGIPVIHCPVALSQQEIIADLRLGSTQFHVGGAKAHWVGKAIARRFPDQAFEYKGQALSYHTPDEMLAMILTGCLTPRPWVLGMSRANEVLLATVWEARYWVTRGLSAEKATVVGYYELEIIRKQLSSPRPVDKDRRNNIVYAAPHFAEHNVYPWEKHWQIINEHMEVLSSTGCQITVVLHPKSARSDYAFLEKKFGSRIHHGPTAEALSSCDLYVCVGSTTALWASSLGIRVIDLSKMYGLEVPLFEEVSRISLVASYEELGNVLSAAFAQGRRLREGGWYVDLDTQRAYLDQRPVGIALIDRIGKLARRGRLDAA